MHIFSFILSIIAFLLCFLPIYTIPISLIALIVAMVAFNKFFIQKDDSTKYVKGFAFASLTLSVLATITSFAILGTMMAFLFLSVGAGAA